MEVRDAKVLIGTPNYMNMFWSEVHSNHIESAVEWKGQGIDFNWMIVGRSFVHFARTQVCDAAINGKFTHVFWVDDDAIIPPNTLKRFIEHDKDVVVAPYPMRKPPHEIGILSHPDGDFHDHSGYRNWTPDDLNKGMVQCDGAGTHCMLIKVDILNKLYGPIAAQSREEGMSVQGTLEDENKNGLPYFVMPKVGTEDMYFCYRVKCKGGEIWCDTDIFAGHVGFAPLIRREHSDYYHDEEHKGVKPTVHNSIPVLSVREGSSQSQEHNMELSGVREQSLDKSNATSLV